MKPKFCHCHERHTKASPATDCVVGEVARKAGRRGCCPLSRCATAPPRLRAGEPLTQENRNQSVSRMMAFASSRAASFAWARVFPAAPTSTSSANSPRCWL